MVEILQLGLPGVQLGLLGGVANYNRPRSKPVQGHVGIEVPESRKEPGACAVHPARAL